MVAFRNQTVRALLGVGLALQIGTAVAVAETLRLAPSRQAEVGPKTRQSAQIELRALIHRVSHGHPSRVVAVIHGPEFSRELHQARYHVASVGVPTENVKVRYAKAGSPIEIYIAPMHTRAPSCAYSPQFYKISPKQNDWDPGVGCATSNNLMAMLDRQHDRKWGRGTIFSDGERAALVVAGYRVYTPPGQ